MLIPSRGFGWVIGGHKRSPRKAHECLVVIGLATDDAVDELMRHAQDAGAEIEIYRRTDAFLLDRRTYAIDLSEWHKAQGLACRTGVG